MIRDYLFDISKIVESACSGDSGRVIAYAEQLAKRLDQNGETEGAQRIRQSFYKAGVQKFGLARATNATSSLSHSVPVDSEFRLLMADEKHFGPNDIQVFLNPVVQATIEQLIAYFHASDQLKAQGVDVSPSLLMYGPPGCGKTHTAKYIASRLQLPLISARADGIISSYLGSTAKNLRLLFDHVAARPCVFFLDELDSLGKMRDDVHELGELKRVVISLLQNIDALGTGHVLLAATNHEHLLDPALWRRFTYKARIGEPEISARRDMLRNFFGSFANNVIIEATAALSQGLSGSDLKYIADECIRDAVLSGATQVEVERAIQEVRKSRSPHVQGGLGISTPTDELTRIRTLRQSDPKMWTQTRLAQLFGISQTQVSRILRQDFSKEDSSGKVPS